MWGGRGLGHTIPQCLYTKKKQQPTILCLPASCDVLRSKRGHTWISVTVCWEGTERKRTPPAEAGTKCTFLRWFTRVTPGKDTIQPTDCETFGPHPLLFLYSHWLSLVDPPPLTLSCRQMHLMIPPYCEAVTLNSHLESMQGNVLQFGGIFCCLFLC